MKKALVIRLGAIGDLIQVTPVLRCLYDEGYEVTLNCKKSGEEVLRNNPYIKHFLFHDESVSNDKLNEHFEELGKGYDKVVNLSGVIEEGLLPPSYDKKYHWSHKMRHRKLNVNYIDAQLKAAGLKQRKMNPELFFSPMEEMQMRDFMKKYKKNFVVVWALSGSSFHKTYPHAEMVMRAFHGAHPETRFITVGDTACMLLEPDASYIIQKSDKWGIRKAMLSAKYADLVISPETGMLNAAGAFKVPKIALLSHSSKENLTKYYENCVSLNADVPCYPCHQLHYKLEECPLQPDIISPVCMAKLSPAKILNAMEDVYNNWRSYGVLCA